MTAVATDLGNVLVSGVPAMVAAIFLIAAYSAGTSVVTALRIIRHKISPDFDSNFAGG
jgi:hypothetical protein